MQNEDINKTVYLSPLSLDILDTQLTDIPHSTNIKSVFAGLPANGGKGSVTARYNLSYWTKLLKEINSKVVCWGTLKK